MELLKTTQELVYIETTKGVSGKTGNPYCFVKFANPLTFENFTISAADEGFKSESLQSGDRVHCDFNIRDYFGRATLNVTNIVKSQ